MPNKNKQKINQRHKIKKGDRGMFMYQDEKSWELIEGVGYIFLFSLLITNTAVVVYNTHVILLVLSMSLSLCYLIVICNVYKDNRAQ